MIQWWHADIDVNGPLGIMIYWCKGCILTSITSRWQKGYLRIPKGFEIFYIEDEVLLSDGMIYWLKDAAMSFWKALIKAHEQMGNSQNKADLCLL